MARITGDKSTSVEADPRGDAVNVARDLNAVVALKEPETYIATPYGEVIHYTEGDVGLATSGSGDVLAGALVGLLARGATVDQAAVGGPGCTAPPPTVWRNATAHSVSSRGSCATSCPPS